MGEKNFRQMFDFKGLHLGLNDLKRPVECMRSLINFQKNDFENYEGRRGQKLAAQHETDRFPYAGLFLYTRLNEDSGITENEIVGFGERPYKLRLDGSAVVAGPANSTFSVLLNTTSGHFEAHCKVSGSNVAGFPYDLGTGLEGAYVRLDTLKDDIDDIAGGGWSMTLTPFARVDGNQVNRSGSAKTTIRAGYTIDASPTDYQTLCIETDDAGIIFVDCADVDGTPDAILRPLRDMTGTFDVNDGASIGVGVYPAAILPIVEDEDATGAGVTLTFKHWEEILTIDYFADSSAADIAKRDAVNGPIYNVMAENTSNCLYFASADLKATVYNTRTEQRTISLMKYDGRASFFCGTAYPDCFIVHTSVGGGTPQVYKYNAEMITRDAQGNEVISNDIYYRDLERDFTVEATDTVDIRDTDVWNFPPFAIVNGLMTLSLTGTSTEVSLTVRNNHLRLGDRVCFSVFTLSTGAGFASEHEFVEGEVTEITSNTSIKVTISHTTVGTVYVYNNALISDMWLQLYRTKADGQTFYELVKMGVFRNNFTAVLDDITDSNLGAEWLGPFVGADRRDVPPAGRLLTQHNGLLVMSGRDSEPNTIDWSGLYSPEHFPVGTNSLDIYSSEESGISALASADTNTLIVFKPSSYFTVQGDFYVSGGQVIERGAVGDVGCPSPGGWKNIRGNIIFLSNKGPRVLQGTQVISLDERVNERFTKILKDEVLGIASDDEDKLATRRTVSVHDKEKRRIIFFIPAETTEIKAGPVYTNVPNSNSITLVYDYAHDEWGEFSYPEDQNMAGGAIEYKDDIYFVGRDYDDTDEDIIGYLFQEANFDEEKYNYADNTEAIENTWQTQWDFVGQPSSKKIFQRVKVWSMNVLSRIAFSLRVRTYKNFDDSASGLDTDTTMDFSSTSTKKQSKKLKDNAVDSLMIEFYNGEIHENPVISGYEIQFVDDTKMEDLEL